MKLKKTALFRELTDNIILEYSRFKLGDVAVIDSLAEKISELISKDLHNNKYVLYTTNKFPTKSYYKKNSLLLADGISEKLKLPLIIGEYRYKYKKDKFYDNCMERKIHLPKISEKEKLKFSGGYIFLMIDDSIFTGTTLMASLDELKNVTKHIMFFSIINLKGSDYSEEEANDAFIRKFGVESLIEILNNEKYVFTTHMLRTIEGLKKHELSSIFKNINNKNKKILIRSFKEYIGKNL